MAKIVEDPDIKYRISYLIYAYKVIKNEETGIIKEVSLLVFMTRKYQFSSVAQSCPTLCDPMNRSMPGFLVHHQFLDPSPQPISTELGMPSNHLNL